MRDHKRVAFISEKKIRYPLRRFGQIKTNDFFYHCFARSRRRIEHRNTRVIRDGQCSPRAAPRVLQVLTNWWNPFERVVNFWNSRIVHSRFKVQSLWFTRNLMHNVGIWNYLWRSQSTERTIARTYLVDSFRKRVNVTATNRFSQLDACTDGTQGRRWPHAAVICGKWAKNPNMKIY